MIQAQQVNTSRSCDTCYIWHLSHVIQKEAQKLSKNELKTNVFVFSLQKGKGWPTEPEEEPMLAWILEDTFPGQHSLIMVHDHLFLLYKSLWATNWKEINPRPFMNKPRFVLPEIANDEDPKSVFEKITLESTCDHTSRETSSRFPLVQRCGELSLSCA